jgi:excinuclease ABC subunit A
MVLNIIVNLIKCADYVIDMGLDGGEYGGEIIATGTPEQVALKADISYTDKYLKKILEK